MSIRNVQAFRVAASKNPEILAEIGQARSWEEMVGVARKFGYRTTVTSHLAFYRTQPKNLNAVEMEMFRDGGFQWCR